MIGNHACYEVLTNFVETSIFPHHTHTYIDRNNSTSVRYEDKENRTNKYTYDENKPIIVISNQLVICF